MTLKIVAQRHADNPFEAVVLHTLERCPFEGIATNNVIIPNVGFRNLPNEQDLLVLTRGLVYTLDAKQLKPGRYRGPSGGIWEYSDDREKWSPCTFMVHPQKIAFKKARAVEDFIRERLPRGMGMPQVIGVIVVPDEANISELGWHGTTETGARLLLTNLCQLPELLEADQQANHQKRPAVEELAALFGVERPAEGHRFPCYLDEHLRIDAPLARLQRPVTRLLYRGFHEQMRRPVRVEILPRFSAESSTSELIRAFRNNFVALSDLQHEAVLRLYAHFDTPMSLILVTEFFSERTLQDVLVERLLTWEEARGVMRPVVELLRQAHSAGIVHRYLDPGCILLTETTPPKVRVQGFFGAVVGGLTTFGHREEDGSPYQAPELQEEDQRRNHLQDAYAVGRCLAACLTGSPHQLPGPEKVPHAVAALLGQLVSRMPGERASAWDLLPAVLG